MTASIFDPRERHVDFSLELLSAGNSFLESSGHGIADFFEVDLVRTLCLVEAASKTGRLDSRTKPSSFAGQEG